MRDYLSRLRQQREICDIYHEVDPDLELPEIHRRIIEQGGPALLFHRVKGSSFPVVTNLFGTQKRVDLAFHNRPEEIVADLVNLATRDFPPSFNTLWKKRRALTSLLKLGTRTTRKAEILDVCSRSPDLNTLPFTKSWPEDGGFFLTLPLVYTEDPNGGPPNLGIYRIQRHSKNTTGLHWQIAKGGGFHYYQAEQKNVPLDVTIFLGGSPALIMSAIAPLPENVPELLLCSLLQEKSVSIAKSPYTPHPLIASAEFALLGKAHPYKRHIEGPFGDHFGYYSLDHDFPVFECHTLYHRKDAIFPATVVGKPRQEDYYIGNYLQKLLSPLFPVVMPGVKALWSYGETGFHSLATAVVKERYYRECMTSAFRILGEGQLALTKFLLLTDQNVNVQDSKIVLRTILERFKPETDLYVFSNLSLDTLDYTGPSLNRGSRGVMLGIGEKIRQLPEALVGTLPSQIKRAAPYCPGCLLIESESEDYSTLCTLFPSWPLLILVDDVKKANASEQAFLWTVFTRFEPAADIYAGKQEIYRNHITSQGSLLINAKMKKTYPKEVECDPITEKLVTENWALYFKN